MRAYTIRGIRGRGAKGFVSRPRLVGRVILRSCESVVRAREWVERERWRVARKW